jgi:antibiotic biosynthesis monooxygenase (ABM) superfamily enzyme
MGKTVKTFNHTITTHVDDDIYERFLDYYEEATKEVASLGGFISKQAILRRIIDAGLKNIQSE